MTRLAFYGIDAIHLKERDELLPGRLVVIEGTDGVGRSTQLNLLRPWLESSGYAVMDTEMTRSVLAGAGLKQAKEGHTLGPITLNLFYATDFVDRFESQILPALRAGFIVLTDRYIYSLMARAIVRGADPQWIRSIYGLALKPDAVFYLKIGLDDLIPRILQSGGFDYWESGMDMRLGADLFESFVHYQTLLLAQFDLMTSEYGFQVIDAGLPVDQLSEQLKYRILPLLPQG
jgi:dTMP kinase